MNQSSPPGDVSPPPPSVQIRRELVQQAVEEILAGMADMGMSPPEGLVAAEFLMWMLLSNGLQLAGGAKNKAAAEAAAKAQALRMLTRLVQRVEQWPNS